MRNTPLRAFAGKEKLKEVSQELKKMGRDISYSRRSARAHYKSDSTFGEQIGNDMYNYIKDKI